MKGMRCLKWRAFPVLVGLCVVLGRGGYGQNSGSLSAERVVAPSLYEPDAAVEVAILVETNGLEVTTLLVDETYPVGWAVEEGSLSPILPQLGGLPNPNVVTDEGEHKIRWVVFVRAGEAHTEFRYVVRPPACESGLAAFDGSISCQYIEGGENGRDTVAIGGVTEMPPREYSLTIATAHGVPDPLPGTRTYVPCAEVPGGVVTSPADEAGGQRWRCTGYTGTGSAPSGAGTSYPAFTITVDSTLTWDWVAQYEVCGSVKEGQGEVSPVGCGWYDAGSDVVFTAQPAQGWFASKWLVDGSEVGSGTETYTLLNVGAPHAVEAVFAPGVTLVVMSEHGAPTPPEGSYGFVKGDLVPGGNVVSPTEDDGCARYVCTGYTGTGSAPSGAGTSYGGFGIDQDSTLTWMWQRQYQVTSSVRAGAGTVTPQAQWYSEGAGAAFLASPNEGYVTCGWFVDGEEVAGEGNSYTVADVSSCHKVEARFCKSVTLTISSDHDAPNPAAGAYSYLTGDEVPGGVVISPADEAGGQRWRCTGYTGTGSAPSGAGTSYPAFTITADSTLTWEWVAQYEVCGSVKEGQGEVSPVGCGWYDAGSDVVFTAQPAQGWFASKWLVDGSEVGSGTETYTLLNVGAPHAVEAVFAPGVTLVVMSEHDAPTPPPGSYGFVKGDLVPGGNVVSPTEDDGCARYVCTGYAGTGDAPSGAGTSYGGFRIDQDSTLTWMWQRQYQVTSSVRAGAGTVTPQAQWYSEGAGATFLARPNEGYVTCGWFVDGEEVAGEGNSYTVTEVDGCDKVEARFCKGVTLTISSDHDAPNPAAGAYSYLTGDEVPGGAVTSPADEAGGQRWRCTGYTGTGSAPSGAGMSYPAFMINEESTLTWQWLAQYRVTASAGQSGTISPAGETWYDDGSSPVYTAHPAGGFAVKEWILDGQVVSRGVETHAIEDLDRAREIRVTFAAAGSIILQSNVEADFELRRLPNGTSMDGAVEGTTEATADPKVFEAVYEDRLPGNWEVTWKSQADAWPPKPAVEVQFLGEGGAITFSSEYIVKMPAEIHAVPAEINYGTGVFEKPVRVTNTTGVDNPPARVFTAPIWLVVKEIVFQPSGPNSEGRLWNADGLTSDHYEGAGAYYYKDVSQWAPLDPGEASPEVVLEFYIKDRNPNFTPMIEVWANDPVVDLDLDGIPDMEDPDADGDGLRDVWEREHLLPLGVKNDRADTDGDGLLDGEEQQAGTDPADPESLLRLSKIEVGNHGSVLLSWISAEGCRYLVEAAASPEGPWMAISEGIDSQGSLTRWTDANSADRSRFYRVVVW